ncbi:tetratricopeptide repeat protein [Scytonema sp. UIC 10036]|uniref:tetratricopeptide repeat protein n=1 Tax=Scytonema sp. UIC 10036 TaxID=2304196 RepID=UPI0012DAF6C0|nr:tetratricopeptide repeat protein [Scytonema sp. UIC 10036]MUH01096.1 tetratricopeptide repeat protein [Scytonema sp. UIC 10036]
MRITSVKRIKSLTAAFCFSFFLVAGSIATLTFEIVPAQAQKSSSAVQRGYNLLKKGWVNDAIKSFQQAVRGNPRSLNAKLGLAISYNRAGRIDEAWNTYQQVLVQDPNNQGALKIVGIMGTYRPEWQVRGIESLSTLLNFNPNDVQARSYRALLYSYQGKFREALGDYEIVLANNPTPEAVLGAAQAYSYSRNYRKALELFDRYRATGKPVTDYAAIAYANTLRETGNSKGAIPLLEAQLQRSKGMNRLAIETRAELAKTYIANGQTTQALSVLEPLQGRPDAVLPLARSLNEIRVSTNDPNLAQQVATLYRQALADTPNPSPALLREVADVYTGLPQGEQTALQLYQQAAAQLPNDKSLIVRQLALEHKLGMLTKNNLKQRLTSELQTLPANTVELQQLGLAVADIDNPDSELLPVYQKLIESQADTGGVQVPFLYFRLAQIYLQLDDKNAAKQALSAYAATPEGTKSLLPQLLAAEIERREGNLEASVQRFQAVLATQPNDEEVVVGALRGLAGVRVQQRRFDEALTIYDQLVARQPQNLAAQLGRTSIGYQSKRISQQEAEAVLNNWLTTQPATNAPPELFSLVGALPAAAQREPLYNYLAQVDPSYIPVQLRLIQAIAKRNPTEAQTRAKQLVANLPNNPSTYQLQGELARAAGDLNSASKAYENILAQQPNNIDALSALGGIRFEQRRYESAREIYSQVVAQKPQDNEARRALVGLSVISDQPLSALAQLEQLELEQMSQGTTDTELLRQRQQIQQDFLQRRGFQPSWESYERR